MCTFKPENLNSKLACKVSLSQVKSQSDKSGRLLNPYLAFFVSRLLSYLMVKLLNSRKEKY